MGESKWVSGRQTNGDKQKSRALRGVSERLDRDKYTLNIYDDEREGDGTKVRGFSEQVVISEREKEEVPNYTKRERHTKVNY